MKKSFFGALAFSITFLACNKDDDSPAKTTAEKIIGSWSIVTQIDSMHYNGTTSTTVYTGISTDYLDFKTNGKLFTSFDNESDTVKYTVVNNYLLFGDLPEQDTFLISMPSDNSLILRNKFTENDDWESVTLSLKK